MKGVLPKIALASSLCMLGCLRARRDLTSRVWFAALDQRTSLDFKGATLEEAFELWGLSAAMNAGYDDSIEESTTITKRLTDVPASVFLEYFCRLTATDWLIVEHHASNTSHIFVAPPTKILSMSKASPRIARDVRSYRRAVRRKWADLISDP